MVMHHFSSNNGPKRLQSQQSPVMVVGVSLVILNTDNSILVETEFWNRLPVNEKYINTFFFSFVGRVFFVCLHDDVVQTELPGSISTFIY